MQIILLILLFSCIQRSIGSSSSTTTATSFEQFGLKLYSTISQNQPGKNVLLSPASVALVMSMCTVGARQETLNQMLHALQTSTNEQLIKTVEQVMQVFSATNQDKHVQLKLANRLYLRKEYQLQKHYLDLVQKSFQADIKLEDFQNESEKVVQRINSWVEGRTNKLIQNLLSPNDVSSATRLILINCIYFKGLWVNQFDEQVTDQAADFHNADGTISKIKLMHQEEDYAYAKENKDLHVQIAHIPLLSDNKNVEFVFTVILPNRGVQLEEVEQKLASKPDLMKTVLDHQSTTTQLLDLYLPKFKIEARYELNDVLEQLGMRDAFSDAADFTGIVSQKDGQAGFSISKVIHRTVMNVNERGLEAAAATVVSGDRASAPADTIEFKVDRPFIFMIRERHHNITLFSGKFLSPSA